MLKIISFISFLLIQKISSYNLNHKIIKRGYEVQNGSLNALYANLFANYEKKLKPRGTVNILFSISLQEIVDLIAKEQVIVLNLWIIQSWLDNRLRWNPSDYNNLTTFHVSADMLWYYFSENN